MSDLLAKLEADGIVVIHDLLSAQTVQDMQRAFQSRLTRIRWNNFDGYEQTEPYHHMVQDVLTLEQGFMDLAIHPAISQTIAAYVGPEYELVEAKGWASLPTKKDVHGWHGDAWYDQELVTDHIPRELKLAMYLTDVSSGNFAYYRYHPLILNAAFLGGIDGEDRRVLGFGNKQNYVPAFERVPASEGLQSLLRTTFYASMQADRLASRVRAGLKRTLGRK